MVNDITLYNENFTLYLTYTEYKVDFLKHKAQNKYNDEFNDQFIGMTSEIDYFPIPYVNKELLSNTIGISLIDIVRNDNKKYNIYANIVVKNLCVKK